MTQLPPPAGYPGPPQAVKYRPRARWWVAGGALLVLAPVVFVASLFTVLSPLFREDGVFPVDGLPHQVSVTAGEERVLFSRDGLLAPCTVTDSSGDVLPQRQVAGEFTINEWVAVTRFDTGDGDLTLRCSAGGPPATPEVRVGQLPSGGTFVVGLLVGIVVPIALGGAGLVVLVVTAVLTASRPARPAA